MSYSQALEAQLQALDYWDTEEAVEFAAFLREGVMESRGAAPSVRHLHQMWGDDLLQAEPYYVAPTICETLYTVAATVPDGATLTAPLAPSHRGFVYLSRPQRVAWKGHEHGVDWCAFTWAPYAQYPPGVDRHDSATMTHAGLDFMMYERRGSWLIPFCQQNWPYGERVDGWTPMGPSRPAEVMPAHDIAGQMILAFLAFVSQRILVSSEQRAERHTRKRMADAGYTHEPVVRVVELRRREFSPHQSTASDPVAWSHRWVVSGHWRQQYYPAADEHRPLFILPYLKGPENRPLKPPRAKVFAVVR